jgi:hypothetical protein
METMSAISGYHARGGGEEDRLNIAVAGLQAKSAFGHSIETYFRSLAPLRRRHLAFETGAAVAACPYLGCENVRSSDCLDFGSRGGIGRGQQRGDQ